MKGAASEITARGRGRGLSHLRRIAKERIRPPDAYLKEREASSGSMNVSSSENEAHLNHLESIGNDIKLKEISEISGVQSVEVTSLVNSAKQTTTVPQDEQENSNTEDSVNIDEEQKSESNTERDKLKENEYMKSTANTDILMQSQLNVNAPEFSFQGKSLETKEEDAYVDVQEDSVDAITGVRDHDFVIGLFQDAVNTLTMSPGHYIAIIDSLLETLQMFISEAGTMQSLVDIILKQAIESQNFVYTAVQMIKLFLEKLVIKRQDCQLDFRSYFYRSLQNVYKELPDLFKDRGNPASLSRAIGIALLFADLLCNLKMPDGKLNKVFRIAVFSSIDYLAKDPTTEMVQTLIKLLKLTGPTLDEHKSIEDGPAQVDEMFDRFRDLSLGTTWLSHLENGAELRGRVFGVYKLHTRSWDKAPSRPVEEPSSTYLVSKDSSDQSASDVDWNEYCGPEELDDGEEHFREEYDDDFELFLKESGQL